MTSDIGAILREYADASAHADDGAHRAGGPYVLDNRGVSCTPEMARFRNAEDAIRGLAGRGDLPDPIHWFLAADADSGCGSCWVSSRSVKPHPECGEKIDRWFAAREALLSLGRRCQGGRGEVR